MTVRVTGHGRTTFLDAMTREVAAFALSTSEGELSGRGYERIAADPGAWDAGTHPTLAWRLDGTVDDAALVTGYFAVDAGGAVLFDEPFDEPFLLSKPDSRISVTVRLLLLGSVA